MKNITAALLGVQKKLEAVSKSADNPYFSSKYADLNTIIAATKPLLNEAGILILQPVGRDALGDFVETQLTHSSGESISSKMYLTANAGADMQKFGAAVTYGRRYGLQSLLVMESEDDDGETAVGRGKGSYQAKSAPVQKTSAVTAPTVSAAPKAFGGGSSTTKAFGSGKATGTVPNTVPQTTPAVTSTIAAPATTASAPAKTSSFKRPSANKGAF